MRLWITLPLLMGSLASPAFCQTWADVAAVLEDRCVLCHSGEFAPLGLSLDSYAGLVAGSENGKVIDTNATENSKLLRRITGQDTPRMPLDGPPFLEPSEIETISGWIRDGSPGPVATAEATAPDPPEDPYADGKITYGEVEIIFKQRCIKCHSDNSKLATAPEGLRLTGRDDILAGGERIAVIPGRPEASEIIRRVEGLADPRMPLDGPPWLTRTQIDLLADWIAGGALSDDFETAEMPVGGKVRFRGILTAPDAIDGAQFRITGGTRIDDRPRVGGAAEVRGRVTGDGSIVAERFRAR